MEAEGVQQLTSSGTDTLIQLTKTVQELSRQVESLKRSEISTSNNNKPLVNTGASGSTARGDNPLVCWGCRQPGHRRKECPTNPWPKVTKTKADQGNEGPLQQ